MTKEILQGQPPPFPPVVNETEALVEIALMYTHIFILIFMIIIMLFMLKRFREPMSIIVVYAFSLLFGVESFEHAHTPFSPLLEIFFLVFQTSIFLAFSIEYYLEQNKKKNRLF